MYGGLIFTMEGLVETLGALDSPKPNKSNILCDFFWVQVKVCELMLSFCYYRISYFLFLDLFFAKAVIKKHKQASYGSVLLYF